jgi:hypothetical protein
MSATTLSQSPSSALDAAASARILAEGYGPGAWHGPDLKAALVDVAPRVAFWRPGSERHNIAEIVLHHAWCVRSVIERLTGKAQEPFVLDGEDWFEVSDQKRPGWTQITALVETQQARLAATVSDIAAGRTASPLPANEQFSLVLGVTCHAIYHAGQIQLLKVLAAASG